MRVLQVRSSLAASGSALVVVLAALAFSTSLTGSSLGVGIACGLVLAGAVAGGAAHAGVVSLGPADVVTLARAMLVCAVAALVADALLGEPVVVPLVLLAVLALTLDAVDGWVARRTGTVSAFGARFDGEVDALLLLVLSGYVAPRFGLWVLTIGTMRYLFWAAGWLGPWLRGRLPYRYWRKVVTATQGIVLVVAVAEVAPMALTRAALVVALILLAESFGRDIVWLWAHRCNAPFETVRPGRPVEGSRR